MAYKRILTYLNNTKYCTEWSEYAVELALKHNAKLIGIAPREIASSLCVSDYKSASSTWLADWQKRIDSDAFQAVTKFAVLCQERGLRRMVSRCVDGSAVEVVRQESILSDLIVLGQYRPGTDTSNGVSGMVESLLMTTGTPVLIVPALGRNHPVAGNVLVAWHESKESGIALHHSLPLLSMANRIEVVEVSEMPDPKLDAALDQVVSYLEEHSVKASRRLIVSPDDVGKTLLSHACETGTEILVVGGYGHARLKEWALGSVTKTIINTMTLPVLMAH